MSYRVKKNVLSIFLCLASSSIYAETNQSLELLTSKIEQHVLNELAYYTDGRVQVSADKIDARLQLKPCAEEQLEIFNPYQTPMLKTSALGIKCNEPTSHWTLYVPIKITVLKNVFVAKQMLMKGTPIRAQDIYQTELDVQKLRQGYFTKQRELLGLVCKQSIAPDSPITPYNIELAKLIFKGEQVSILASQENLSISMSGIALDNGALGDRIKVKNLSSKRIIETQVLAKKQVQVIL